MQTGWCWERKLDTCSSETRRGARTEREMLETETLTGKEVREPPGHACNGLSEITSRGSGELGVPGRP